MINNNNIVSVQEHNQKGPETEIGSYPSKSLLLYILIAAILFLISLIMGLFVSPQFANDAFEELQVTLKPLIETLNPLIMLPIIFLNNAIKALGAIILGILLGLPPIFFIVANGFVVGVAVTALKSNIGYGVIAASLAPHGIIEIPILLLSAALGLRIGWESLKYLTRQKSSVKEQLHQGIRIYIKWILAGLFIAAVIEIFITPLFIILAGGKELFIK